VDRNTGRQVAIKFYAHQGGLDWSILSREVEKLAFLSADRYVVQLLDVGWDADPPYYVMEYMENGSLEEALAGNCFALKQDTELLGEHVVRITVNEALSRAVEKRKIKPEEIDWFLPHYSSEYFRDKIHDAMAGINFKIPYEKWFTNLTYKGNTGAASIYVMLEELFHSDKLKEGQRLLCYIPESGRFSVAYMLLTVI